VVVKSRDPLEAVMSLGASKRVVGVVAVPCAARVALIEVDMLRWTHELRLAINERLALQYEIEVEKPKAEEPKAPEPEPEPPKVEEAKPVVKAAEPPPKAAAAPPPPPAAAQAGAVVTAPPDNEPVDFTNTFATGNADQYAGGVTQAGGTSTTAVTNRNAQATGTPGGTGTAPAPQKAVVGPDRSRAAGSVSTDWACPFPAEADTEQIDEMKVSIEATIGADGRVLSARFVKDPGYGFGRAAVQCAQRQKFNAALDHDGNAVTSTRTFNVSFTR
jgi:protein TonB